MLSPVPNANNVFPLLGKLPEERLQLLSEVCPLMRAVREPNEGFCYIEKSFSRMKHYFQMTLINFFPSSYYFEQNCHNVSLKWKYMYQ